MKCKSIKRSSVVPRLVFACFILLATAMSATIAFSATPMTDGRSMQSPFDRRITAIEVVEKPDAVSLLVKADHLLNYTPMRQASPLALALYFPQTALGVAENIFTPNNPVVQRVTAQPLEDGSGTVKVLAYLKRDAAYDIRRLGTGLRVSFSTTNLRAGGGMAPTRTAYPTGTVQFGLNQSRMTAPPTYASTPTAPPDQEATYLPNATRLQSVYAAKFGDTLKVFVGADGRITNYKSYTIDNPPSIVFDLFNISSPYRGEKVVPVNTKWVSQVRYHSYSDRVRVILDTQRAYLSNFSANPVENGLVIRMGSGAYGSPTSASWREDRAPMPSAGPSATQVQSVYATQLPDGMLVTVRGNGMMSEFRTATDRNPPRIIITIPGVRSIYQGEQFFPVDTSQVKNVRHSGTAEGVQVVVETRPQYLSAFEARPDKDGMTLLIRGAPGQDMPMAGTRSPESMPATNAAGEPIDYTLPAWVFDVNFNTEPSGQAALEINATRPVRYDVTEMGDNKIALTIFNAKLPPHQQQPIEADRVDSPVSRIVPTVSSDNAANTVFEIALKESVPYFVDQEDGRVSLKFEASSIPPEPVERMTVAQPSPMVPPPAGDVPPPGGTAAMPSGDVPMTASPTVPPPADLTTGMGDDPLAEDDALLEEETPQYTGEKIALDFFETDIKNVFRILKEVSGMNFAVDKDVTGKVTLTLSEPVPWDQVLDLILKMNKLGKSVEGNIIRVATRETLDEEDKLRQEKKAAALTLRDQEKQLEPLKTEYIAVNYSNADTEIKPHIEKLLTKDRGSVSVDSRTNVVIMTDTEDRIRQAKELIRKLDRVTPQVIIEARVVEADTTFSQAIGAVWQLGIGVQEVSQDSNASDNAASAFIGGMTDTVEESVNNRVGVGPERGYNNLGGTYGYNMGMNFPAAAENPGRFGFNFTRIAGTPFLLNAKLEALETQGEAKIISAPKVVTLDNKKATIKQGVSYPFQTVEDGEVNIEFKDVDLLLEVTPHVTPDNRISMNINITKNDLGNIVAGQQSFTTKEAQTELLVNDGDTVVIGGIIKTTENTSYSGVPGLSKVPILGWLFKNESDTNRKEELLIFITPRIVQLEQRTALF